MLSDISLLTFSGNHSTIAMSNLPFPRVITLRIPPWSVTDIAQLLSYPASLSPYIVIYLSQVIFKNARVPVSYLVGEENKGFSLIMVRGSPMERHIFSSLYVDHMTVQFQPREIWNCLSSCPTGSSGIARICKICQ